MHSSSFEENNSGTLNSSLYLIYLLGYSPHAKLERPIETVPIAHLEIEVWCAPNGVSIGLMYVLKLISGQQLCPYWRKCRSVTVEISTYGIPADTSTKLTAEVRLVEALCHFRSLTLQTQDAFWPQWGLEEKVYSRDIIMPELVGGIVLSTSVCDFGFILFSAWSTSMCGTDSVSRQCSMPRIVFPSSACSLVSPCGL